MEMTSARVVNITGAHHALASRPPAGPAFDAAGVRIDGWLVQPALNRLTRDEVSVRLRPQLMDVIVCLASQPGRVFGKDELVARVWDGRLVAGSAVSRCIAELRTVFADDAQRPHVIETIPKRGYRLIAPVERVRVSASAPTPAPAITLVAATPRPASREPDAVPRSLWQRLAGVVRVLASKFPNRV